MKSKILVAVITMFFGVTATSVAQQKKAKKVYHKTNYRKAKAKQPRGPLVLLPPAPPKPGTHPSRVSLQPRVVRLPAPPRPQVILPPPPPVVYHKKRN